MGVRILCAIAALILFSCASRGPHVKPAYDPSVKNVGSLLISSLPTQGLKTQVLKDDARYELHYFLLAKNVSRDKAITLEFEKAHFLIEETLLKTSCLFPGHDGRNQLRPKETLNIACATDLNLPKLRTKDLKGELIIPVKDQDEIIAWEYRFVVEEFKR